VSIVGIVVGFVYYQCELQNNPHCTTLRHEIMEQWKDLKSGGEYKKSLLAAAEAERQRLVELELQRQREAAAAAAAEAERQLREAEEAARLAREEEEYRALMKRPWACNLPFAYLFHARCRRLASQNPVFDLQALIQSMLQ
jgi:predicted aminopeptidase